MRGLRVAAALLLCLSGAVSGQEPDRHQERRDWLARRRAGELEDTLGGYARGVDLTRAGAGPRRAPLPLPIPEEQLPHRFAGRFRPNYESDRSSRYWPLEPLSPYRRPWSGLYGGGYGDPGYGQHHTPYGLPYAPWTNTPWPPVYASAALCARVTLQFDRSAPLELFLFLPRTAPYDAADLELLLDRELTAARPLVLQDEYGAWVRVHPSARIERIRIGSCRG